MNFLMKYPSRERPDIFFQTLEKWISYATPRGKIFNGGANRFHWVFTFDMDDATMSGGSVQRDINKLMSKNHTYSIHYIRPLGKIHACNAHVNDHLTTETDVLMLVSDDMIPLKMNWDSVVKRELLCNFPDYDGALHFDDGLQKRNLITLSCMGAKLYKRFMYFYHPDYKSCFADDEFTQIVYAWNKVVYIEDPVFVHRWVGFYHKDRLHDRNHQQMFEDQPVFIERQKAGFPLNSIFQTSPQ